MARTVRKLHPKNAARKSLHRARSIHGRRRRENAEHEARQDAGLLERPSCPARARGRGGGGWRRISPERPKIRQRARLCCENTTRPRGINLPRRGPKATTWGFIRYPPVRTWAEPRAPAGDESGRVFLWGVRSSAVPLPALLTLTPGLRSSRDFDGMFVFFRAEFP